MRKSVFGSLRSLGSVDDDQHSTKARSKGSSGDEDDLTASASASASVAGSSHLKNLVGSHVLHHGEVQTSSGMWRKKIQYLVLTDTHLVRFKSQNKAAEVFPSIPASWSKSNSSSAAAAAASVSHNNRLSMASIATFPDPQVAAHGDMPSGIALNSIVAVYKLDDGRPHFSIEVCYMDDRTSKPSILHLQLNDPQESELWLGGLRLAAEQARSIDPIAFDEPTLEYVARTMEQECDYDPLSFSLYRVVQRIPAKSGGRSQSEDLTKQYWNVCYLAIGVHKIHLIPLPKSSNRTSVVSLSDLELGMCFGIMTLMSLTMLHGDDSFHLIFRYLPCLTFSK